MDSQIIFTDLTSSLNLIGQSSLRSWIINTANLEGFSVGEINFLFCKDEYLHKINLEFLNHDTLTDIITFDYCTDNVISGEIYISLDRVTENAQKFKQDLNAEIKRIIIHGVLHLLGYKDKIPEDKEQMTSKEDYYISLLPESN